MNLCRRNYDEARLRRAFRTALRIHCSIAQGENLHAAGALTQRQHPFYDVASTMARATLYYSSPVVIPPTDTVLANLFKKLDNVMKKRPSKINGMCMFLSDTCNQLKKIDTWTSPGQKRDAFRQACAEHASHYNSLTDSLKDKYRRAAELRRDEQLVLIRQSIDEHKSALDIYLSRRAKENATQSGNLKTTSFRFTPEDHEQAERHFTSGTYGRQHVEDKIKAMKERVPAFSEEEWARLDVHRSAMMDPIPKKKDVASWVHDVCRRIYAFRGAVLEFRVQDTKKAYFALHVMFAGPHTLCMQPLYLAHEGTVAFIFFCN